MRYTRIGLMGSAAAVMLMAAGPARPQEVSYSLYGTPGLIETPTAQSASDAEIAASLGLFKQQQRSSFTFQLLPRLSGTFRYTRIPEFAGVGTDTIFDRSFDLRYRVLDEGRFGALTPAVAVGLQDFIGTGKLSSEYIVASKTITPAITASVGLGWGRLGSRNGFTNPLGVFGSSLETRENLDVGFGGKPSFDQFFHGDAALFGGVTWDYSDKLTLKAEYSSDAYIRETANGTIDASSPLNFGVSYRWKPGINVDLAYLYGSELATGLTFTLNPRERAFVSGTEPAPVPVRARGTSSVAASWGAQTGTPVAQSVQAALAQDDIRLLGLSVDGSIARVRYANDRYRSEAQAMGHVARVLTQTLPDNVTTFVMEPTQRGMALSATTLQRGDLEQLENTATAADSLRARIQTRDAAGKAPAPVPHDNPAFTWGLGPYAELIVFNGDAPVQVDVGLQLETKYTITPNLIVSGNFRQSLRGKREIAPIKETPNNYYNVRTDGDEFGADGTPVITDLTLAHYGRPAANLYSRITLGYFEKMYGGVSGEVLWKPVDSRLAVGAEVDYARQRETDMLLGFQDYDIVTGHLSAYYAFDNGFHTQVDVGRYLAGDWGATVALDREFENGWKVGAYFTVTDMPFDQFGEGSFDKGIRLTVPVDYFLGNASRQSVDTSLASLTRDGGAQVNVDGRLYDTVRDGHLAGPMGDTWGRFWR